MACRWWWQRDLLLLNPIPWHFIASSSTKTHTFLFGNLVRHQSFLSFPYVPIFISLSYFTPTAACKCKSTIVFDVWSMQTMLMLFLFSSIKDFQPIKISAYCIDVTQNEANFYIWAGPERHSQLLLLSFPNSISHTTLSPFAHTMNHTSEDLEKQSKVLDIDELEQEKVHQDQENSEEKEVSTWKGKTWKQRLAFLKSKEFLRVLILGQSKL